MFSVFNTAKSTVSLKTENIDVVYYNKLSYTMNIDDNQKLKEWVLHYEMEDYFSVEDIMLTFKNKYDKDFIYVDGEHGLLLIRKSIIDNINSDCNRVWIISGDKEYDMFILGPIRSIDTAGFHENGMYNAQKTAFELLIELNN